MDDTDTKIWTALLDEAADGEDAQWWLSFADETGFLGVAIVEARGIATAVTRTHLLGINPGGEVHGVQIPGPGRIGAEWCDRLLTRYEVSLVPEPC